MLSALSGPSKFTYLEVNTASPIGAIFSTDDNSKDLTFTAIGLKTKDQSGKWLGADFAVGKALTTADTAKGDQFVVVTLDGISKLEQKWDIKLDKTAITDTEAQKVFQYYNGSSDENTTATAQKLGDLGITGIDTAEDSKIEVSFSQYKDIPTGNAVKMSFKFTGTGSATAKAASYDVSITIGGKTYLFADLNALNTSATTYDRWIENVNRDLMITSISVKVNKPLLAVENVSFTNDNKTMIVKFNQPIQHKDGSGHSLASSDFSLTSGGLQVVRMDISGDTVTIVYDKPIVSTNTLTITTNVAARDNVKNVLKNPVIVNISTDTDGSLKATFA